MRSCGYLAAGMVLFLLLVLLFFPFNQTKEQTKNDMCLSNVKRQALGMSLYKDDCDGRFPVRDAWMDAIVRYSKEMEYEPFHHPGPNWQTTYGYAFNAILSCEQAPSSPERVPLTYDSVNPIRNASDKVTSLPSPGRHAGKNSIAYVDGHAKSTKPSSSSGVPFRVWALATAFPKRACERT